MPLMNLSTGFKFLWRGRIPSKSENESGEISSCQALMTALSATIGTGNIAGVATAVFLGGPGALFWMWCKALVGMATKFSEAVLAVKYREVDDNGHHYGGPMYYIRNGLGSRWTWLGAVFALFGACASFGIGDTVQSNSFAAVLEWSFNIPSWLTGMVLMILVVLVLIGGIHRIGQVAGALVPFMALTCLISGLVVPVINAKVIPEALSLVITHAFSPVAATGGFAGAAVWVAIRFGVARGVFSNEAGRGSAPIAYAAAKTQDPVRQGMIAMLGTFIDTIIVCSIIGLVIITSGLWTSGESGAALTSMAFAQAMPGIGQYIVVFSLAVFAFTTIIGWSFYGESCVVYLLGTCFVKVYRLMWVIALPVGATVSLDFIWLVADSLNAMMALPNLIALVLLSLVVFKLVREYMGRDNKSAH
ncbi:Amino-acid carrier protein AlsT [invertebrate metagenome]|uniref:Amino-acid carrier protein AlsT n=1 Tax=invertebrate metagenome TaxID=1711999 RepID=A0A2H9T4M5_9ZZZZ